ncbi:MAG TPA: hypothetical protein VKZ53_31695 [Candidatus Angelobacter sp.]|nr:hypothetical protein [Candidatus Angelobacter sp.]
MPFEMNALVAASMVVLLLIVIVEARRNRSWSTLWLHGAVLIGFGIFLNFLFGFPFPAQVNSKGRREKTIFIAALYSCMIIGMLCQYIYRHLDEPKRFRKKWDWGLFVAPLFTSPLIFMPLYAAFDGAGLDLTTVPEPRFMIFFIAFQNGFFWKEFFDRRRKEAGAKRES